MRQMWSGRITPQAADELRQEGRIHLASTLFRALPATAEPPTLNVENYADMIRNVPSYSPTEKLDLLLDRVAKSTPHLGASSQFKCMQDYPVISAANWQE